MSLGMYILDENGNPKKLGYDCKTGEWAEFMMNTGKRQLAKDLLGDVLISTVFLGIDHNYAGTSEPVLWETMIFGGQHAGYQKRYTSKEQALEGHKEAVELVKGSLK